MKPKTTTSGRSPASSSASTSTPNTAKSKTTNSASKSRKLRGAKKKKRPAITRTGSLPASKDIYQALAEKTSTLDITIWQIVEGLAIEFVSAPNADKGIRSFTDDGDKSNRVAIMVHPDISAVFLKECEGRNISMRYAMTFLMKRFLEDAAFQKRVVYRVSRISYDRAISRLGNLPSVDCT